MVPRVDREEFVNAGVILFCKSRGFLGAQVEFDEGRLRALWPRLALEEVRAHLEAIPKVCAGGREAGPIGMLSARERFQWLVSPRSTVIQLSAVHSGLCDTPEQALDHLFQRLVAVPAS
ncbi:MAG: DUF3037 domain-containing protein [Bryobacterales bacterium]|nr:DUF3037 domain-containing protein [Bryobacterales bacterium]